MENRSSIVPPNNNKQHPSKYIAEQLAVKWRDENAETKLRLKSLYEKEKVNWIWNQ